MTPDRALDRQVAEQVFGAILADTTTLGDIYMDFGDGCNLQCPFYTSDPAAMLQVIEQMRERGYSILMNTNAGETDERQQEWHVLIRRVNAPFPVIEFVPDGQVNHNESGVHVYDPSLLRAVCLAALAALKAGGKETTHE